MKHDKCVKEGFGRFLRSLRKKREMTLPELAAKTGLSKGLLSKIENGAGNPCLTTLHELARVLNVTISIVP